MHEQSLVNALLRQVDQVRREHHGRSVSEVHVELGPLSGVEPLLLTSAFDLLAPHSPVAGARLVIEEVPLTARCNACQREFEIERFVFRCLTCGGNVVVTGGDTLLLASVKLECDEFAVSETE